MSVAQKSGPAFLLGGEMEIEAGSLWDSEPLEPQVFEGLSVLSGRTALRTILRGIGKQGGDAQRKIALPSYLCESLLDPVKSEGFVPVFFRVDAALRIDTDDLLSKIREQQPAAVLFINYFGFPVDRNMRTVINRLKARCLVIEDCVQGSLIGMKNPPVGNLGHFVFTSFRKYLPVPDGGLLINRSKIPLPVLRGGSSTVASKVFVGKLMRGSLRTDTNPEHERQCLKLFAEAEEELSRDVPMEAGSPMTTQLLARLNLEDAMRRRRSNFRFLLQAFSKRPLLRRVGLPLYPELPPRVSPLFFPIRVKRGLRNALRKRLQSERIFCPVHWPLPKAVDRDVFLESHQLSADILNLPIDQRYTPRDMNALLLRLIAADTSL